jgi:hypothetical protein
MPGCFASRLPSFFLRVFPGIPLDRVYGVKFDTLLIDWMDYP